MMRWCWLFESFCSSFCVFMCLLDASHFEAGRIACFLISTIFAWFSLQTFQGIKPWPMSQMSSWKSNSVCSRAAVVTQRSLLFGFCVYMHIVEVCFGREISCPVSGYVLVRTWRRLAKMWRGKLCKRACACWVDRWMTAIIFVTFTCSCCICDGFVAKRKAHGARGKGVSTVWRVFLLGTPAGPAVCSGGYACVGWCTAVLCAASFGILSDCT